MSKVKVQRPKKNRIGMDLSRGLHSTPWTEHTVRRLDYISSENGPVHVVALSFPLLETTTTYFGRREGITWNGEKEKKERHLTG